MWGIVPAAGSGTRIQPLAFSKELLPVGSRLEGGVERPRAVSEYLIERMVLAGADKIGFVIAPGKSDIVDYYGSEFGGAVIAYVVQPRPGGLCDAIFRIAPFVDPLESVIIGLPDTIWFPEDALQALPDDCLAFLLFPVQRPEFFDAVVLNADQSVRKIEVKSPDAGTNWVWGAFKMPGAVLHDLHRLWLERGRSDEYVGTLINAWIARGGRAFGSCTGRSYVDVGTLHGYRKAIGLLSNQTSTAAPSADRFRPHAMVADRLALRGRSR
jgi:glucose-1-phosphate thymidylyltransferase